MVVERTHRLSMRISEDEWSIAGSSADGAGITASDWLCLRIREAYAGTATEKETLTKNRRAEPRDWTHATRPKHQRSRPDGI